MDVYRVAKLMVSDSCSGLYLNLYFPSYKQKVGYLSCPGGVLKMYYEYHPWKWKNSSSILIINFGPLLLLSIYNIIHVKTFASSPRDVSKGQYSKIAQTILDFEHVRYESEICHYIQVWQYDVLKNNKNNKCPKKEDSWLCFCPSSYFSRKLGQCTVCGPQLTVIKEDYMNMGSKLDDFYQP